MTAPAIEDESCYCSRNGLDPDECQRICDGKYVVEDGRVARRVVLPPVTIVPARRPVPDRYAIHREPGTKKKCRTPLTAADCSVCY